jgi:hypothetical protein
MRREPSLDALLDLDGQVLVVDLEGNHRVRFAVRRVPVTQEKPPSIMPPLDVMAPLDGAIQPARVHAPNESFIRWMARSCGP